MHRSCERDKIAGGVRSHMSAVDAGKRNHGYSLGLWFGALLVVCIATASTCMVFWKQKQLSEAEAQLNDLRVNKMVSDEKAQTRNGALAEGCERGTARPVAKQTEEPSEAMHATLEGSRSLQETLPPASTGELHAWFDKRKHGPGIMKWRHYFDTYERHFARFRGTDVHIAEIGVFSGGSMKMWRWYFGERAVIYGIDINNGTLAYQGNPQYGSPARIFIGDQSKKEFWDEFKRQVPRLDILLDDGGHQAYQQRATLDAMLPHLAPGGVLLTEDLHGSRQDYVDYVVKQSLSDRGLNHAFTSRLVSAIGDLRTKGLSHVQAHLAELSFYAYVVVFTKLRVPRNHFYMDKRGSVWQPPSFWQVQQDAIVAQRHKTAEGE